MPCTVAVAMPVRSDYLRGSLKYRYLMVRTSFPLIFLFFVVCVCKQQGSVAVSVAVLQFGLFWNSEFNLNTVCKSLCVLSQWNVCVSFASHSPKMGQLVFVSCSG